MNIMYIAHEQDLKGSGLCMIEIVKYMISMGHNVWVLLPKDSKPKGCLEETLKILGANILLTQKIYQWVHSKKTFKYFWFIKHNIRNYILALNIARQLKSIKIDIVHTNTSVIDLGVYLSKRLKAKHIWHFREFITAINKKFLFPKRDIRFINKNSDAVIFTSEILANEYKNKISNSLMNVIYNGIDFEEQKTEKTIKTDNIFNLLITGNLCELKNQKEAILAVSELKKRKINNICIYIAGDGDQLDLKNIVKSKQIENNVKFLGFVSDMKSLRNNIDIELVCSKTEGFGRVTIEAMASGIAVIVSDSELSATREIINDKINGLLYKHGNINDLADKIELLIKNRHYLNKLSKAAIERSKDFSLKKELQSIEKIYKKVINK